MTPFNPMTTSDVRNNRMFVSQNKSCRLTAQTHLIVGQFADFTVNLHKLRFQKLL